MARSVPPGDFAGTSPVPGSISTSTERISLSEVAPSGVSQLQITPYSSAAFDGSSCSPAMYGATAGATSPQLENRANTSAPEARAPSPPATVPTAASVVAGEAVSASSEPQALSAAARTRTTGTNRAFRIM